MSTLSEVFVGNTRGLILNHINFMERKQNHGFYSFILLVHHRPGPKRARHEKPDV